MKIRIYELHGIRPTEIWEDYPFVPNVGDRVYTDTSYSKTVDYRVFRKDYVDIIVK